MLLEPNGINNSACSRNSPCELNLIQKLSLNAKCEDKKEGGGTAKENTSHMFMLHVCTYVSMHINIYIYI